MIRRSSMSDQLEKKHCSLYYILSQHLSAEPSETINTSVRITSLRVDIRTQDLSITNPNTAVQFRRVFIARSKKLKIQKKRFIAHPVRRVLGSVTKTCHWGQYRRMFCIRCPNRVIREDVHSFIVWGLQADFQGAAPYVPTGSSLAHLNPELVLFA